MDSLPQEIIDEIIDNLPPSSLRSSSLVAKRWRTRSQQRTLCNIDFPDEFKVNQWYTDTHNDPGGIASYVQSAEFKRVDKWQDPTLLGRVLKNFDSLTTLRICKTIISDEILERISHGKFVQGITTLGLYSLQCSLSTLMSIILAFPNVQNLDISHLTTTPREAPSTYSAVSPRRPLDSLALREPANREVTEVLASLQFTSRSLHLYAPPQNIQKLLVLSSATIVKLVLIGMCSLCVNRKIILTTLQVHF